MRTRKGFTLVELAIVLVIIGLILGAVLKGKDVITNARAKRFVSWVRQWEVYQWTFYDRKGRFLGDGDISGIIGDNNATDDAKSDFDKAYFLQKPASNSIILGKDVLYIYYGYVGKNKKKNVIVVCASSDCSLEFSKDLVPILESFDTVVDGVANGTEGNVVCTTSTFKVSESKYIATRNSNTITLKDCNETAKVLLYYF